MGAPVVHWEINARNAGRLREFYSGLFGWKIDSNNPMNYGLVNTGSKKGIMGGISQAEAGTPFPPVTFYIEVDDVAGALGRVEAAGGRMLVPVTEIPQMVTFALFADPDGNSVGLVKSIQTPGKTARRKPSSRRPKRARKSVPKRRKK